MPEQVSGTQPYTHKCKECGKTLNSDSELREHQKLHKAQGQQGSQGAGAGRPAGGRS